MAEKRMFTKKVTDDDNFMSLSSSAQALYLHLSMSADDDGFCNQVSLSMFKAHASVQDLQALLEKRYIYQFESGVIVIKHWRMANALRKDRYTETAFQEELAMLKLKKNGSYTMSEIDENDDGCRLVAGWLPQNSKEKNIVDYVRKEEVFTAPSFDEFKAYWQEYCRERGFRYDATDAEKCYLWYAENNWKQKGGNQIEDWKATVCKAVLGNQKGKKEQSVFSSDASYDLSEFEKRAIGLRDWKEEQ